MKLAVRVVHSLKYFSRLVGIVSTTDLIYLLFFGLVIFFSFNWSSLRGKGGGALTLSSLDNMYHHLT